MDKAVVATAALQDQDAAPVAATVAAEELVDVAVVVVNDLDVAIVVVAAVEVAVLNRTPRSPIDSKPSAKDCLKVCQTGLKTMMRMEMVRS